MISYSQIHAIFRREAPKFGRHCPTWFSQRHAIHLINPLKLVRNPSIIAPSRPSSARAPPVRSNDFTEGVKTSTLLSRLLGHTKHKFVTDEGGEDARGRNYFPSVSSKTVAYWLLGSAASIFGIVVFGGLTRLTESGCVSSFISVSIIDFVKLEHNRMEACHGIISSYQ